MYYTVSVGLLYVYYKYYKGITYINWPETVCTDLYSGRSIAIPKQLCKNAAAQRKSAHENAAEA